MTDRPKYMDPEDDFVPDSITIDELIDKLRRVRAAHGNLEVYTVANGDFIRFSGIAVDRTTYPNIAVLNNPKGI